MYFSEFAEPLFMNRANVGLLVWVKSNSSESAGIPATEQGLVCSVLHRSVRYGATRIDFISSEPTKTPPPTRDRDALTPDWQRNPGILTAGTNRVRPFSLVQGVALAVPNPHLEELLNNREDARVGQVE